jgi:DNA invertase Pin-like site-specific DNA recombinase
MSTDRQEYSIAYQQVAIRKYAIDHGLAVVRTFADLGKSGLRTENRTALLSLLNEVRSGNADFEIIIVYDVSRWGRFQDTDESAYYEFLCRRSNVRVEYCAEPFTNDGSALAVLLKNIKRTMAAEYSRELSAKVHAAAIQVAGEGYLAGGLPGYGLRRMFVDPTGNRFTMERGTYKAFKYGRTVLVPGPAAEVRTIQQMFDMFVHRELTFTEIARNLNKANIVSSRGLLWKPSVVRSILMNERYAGTLVYNKRSAYLGTKNIKQNDPTKLVKVPGAIDSILSPGIFAAAQARMARGLRGIKYSQDELLERLKRLREKHGRLSASIIATDTPGPGRSAYESNFGSLMDAYRLIGYEGEGGGSSLNTWRQARSVRRSIAFQLITALDAKRIPNVWLPRRNAIAVDGRLTIGIGAAFYRRVVGNYFSWLISRRRNIPCDFTVVVRMDMKNEQPMDFYLVPETSMPAFRLCLGKENQFALRMYRCVTFERLVTAIQIQLQLITQQPVSTDRVIAIQSQPRGAAG